MKKLPTARQNNLVIQNMDTELLVYDLEINKAFSLNQTSALVYNACNGETTFDELKVKHNFTDDLIYLTLDELKKESLIADNNYQSPFVGMSRRQAAKNVGLATMLALPLIYTIIAPTAALALSGCLALAASCSATPQCCSTCCSSGACVTQNSLALGAPCSSSCACASGVCAGTPPTPPTCIPSGGGGGCGPGCVIEV
ncbi:MAG: PqqD family protein [Pyrinomonadaceae bacterium]|nr:PqqD family protein [Pyrinomonadaceae bacterium]